MDPPDDALWEGCNVFGVGPAVGVTMTPAGSTHFMALASVWASQNSAVTADMELRLASTCAEDVEEEEFVQTSVSNLSVDQESPAPPSALAVPLSKRQRKRRNRKQRGPSIATVLSHVRGDCIQEARLAVKRLTDAQLDLAEEYMSLSRSVGSPSRRKRRLAWVMWLQRSSICEADRASDAEEVTDSDVDRTIANLGSCTTRKLHALLRVHLGLIGHGRGNQRIVDMIGHLISQRPPV